MSKIIIIHDNGEVRQEIGQVEIPPVGNKHFHCCFSSGLHNDVIPCAIANFPIPKPMKKVWKWETLWGNNRLISDHSELPPVPLSNGCRWAKVKGSEKEVEV